MLALIDITKLHDAESALANETADLERLLQVSEQLVVDGNTTSLLESILGAAISILHADSGIVQLFDEETGQVAPVASSGLDLAAQSAFAGGVPSDGGMISEALSTGRRVIRHNDAP